MARKPAARPGFRIGDVTVAPGARETVVLPVSRLADHTPAGIHAHVVHGRRKGPVLFVSAAIHGDEVIGVEIVRRLLRAGAVERMAGTLIAVPIVNAFGFLGRSRYLPDRRDLNRSFPGDTSGSLASRLAHIFLTEVVDRADFGIDLHSAAIHRENLPQIRLTPGNARLQQMGETFGAPVMMRSRLREGSLRMAAEARGVDVLLFEAGEGLRFDENAARSGVEGILRVMQGLGMIGARGVPKARIKPLMCDRSGWIRAGSGGLLRTLKATGEVVEGGTVLGVISDPFGETEVEVVAPETGIVIGRTNLPVVSEGDALFHIGLTPRPAEAERAIEAHDAAMGAESLWDEDEII